MAKRIHLMTALSTGLLEHREENSIPFLGLEVMGTFVWAGDPLSGQSLLDTHYSISFSISWPPRKDTAGDRKTRILFV